jgi:hypothetical protein
VEEFSTHLLLVARGSYKRPWMAVRSKPLAPGARALKRQLEREQRELNGVRPGSLSAAHLPGISLHPRLPIRQEDLVEVAPITALDAVRREEVELAKDWPLRRYVLRSGEYVPAKLPALTELPQARPPNLVRRHVSRAEAEALVQKSAAERLEWLKDLASAPANATVVAEDLSLRPSAFVLAGDSRSGQAFVEQLGCIGKSEGVGITHLREEIQAGIRQDQAFAPGENVQAVVFEGLEIGTWLEDLCESNANGDFSIHPRVRDAALPQAVILAARVERMGPMLAESFGSLEGAAVRRSEREGEPPHLIERAMHIQIAALALAHGASLRQNLTYLEGGNTLRGVLPSGEPYALVGKDSVALSKFLLERDLSEVAGQPVELTDGQLKAAIAKDLGISPAHTFFVEQPGEFHLDMSLGLFGPGVVVLNDARDVARRQIEWMREDHRAAEPQLSEGATAAERAEYDALHRAWQEAGERMKSEETMIWKRQTFTAMAEDRCAEDLIDAGLTVHRVAASFDYDKRRVKFLNGCKGTNPHGKRFFVALGGDPRAEQHFLAECLRLGLGIDHFYFLDRVLSRESLSNSGGVNCRTKALCAAQQTHEASVHWK